jgi:hypothetical protein
MTSETFGGRSLEHRVEASRVSYARSIAPGWGKRVSSLSCWHGSGGTAGASSAAAGRPEPTIDFIHPPNSSAVTRRDRSQRRRHHCEQ